MHNNQVDLKNTKYYQLLNLNFEFALYITSGSQNFQKEKPTLQPPQQQSLGQMWQIIRIPDRMTLTNCYQIVHTRSTLVLTKVGSDLLLRFGKQSNQQLFKIQNQNNIIRFSSYQNNQWFLYFDKSLKIGSIQRSNKKCQWLAIPALKNEIINRSSYFQNCFSSLAIDVPQASLKDGKNLIQYSFNNRFNQRFNIYYENKYYKIANLNSKKFLTVHKKCRQNDYVTQQSDSKIQKQQYWIIQYAGKNLYYIRSAIDPNMMLGIRENSYEQNTPIITTNKQQFSLWKIVGFLPQRQKINGS